MDNSEFSALMGALNRIAGALESLARGSEPEALNLVKPIGDFTGFDWSSIGASVVQKDSDGPTHLEHGGYIWTRRSPKNKFQLAIWFSRGAGKDPEGNVNYLRLITFRTIGEADPLPEKAVELLDPVGQPARKPAAAPEASKPNGNGSQHAPVTVGKVATDLAKQVKPSQAPEAEKKPAQQPAKRPYTPDQLRSQLEAHKTVHIGKEATEKQRNLIAMLLELCFAGEGKTEEKRHLVQEKLYGRSSLKELFDAEILAAIDWLKPITDSGGAIKPDPIAVNEVRQVYQEAVGQTEMPL
jgi:hypothetical protein